MADTSQDSKEKQPYVVVQAPAASKVSPLLVLCVLQFLFMAAAALWFISEKTKNQTDATPEADAKTGEENLTRSELLEVLAARVGKSEKPKNEASGDSAITLAAALPRSVTGISANLEWHTNGIDFFALSAIQYYTEVPEVSIASISFAGGDTIELKAGQPLRLAKDVALVESVGAKSVTLKVRDKSYRMNLLEAGMQITHTRPITSKNNPSTFVGNDPSKANDVELPSDPRDTTSLPDAVKKKIREAGGEIGPDPVEDDMTLPPVVWTTHDDLWEAKWKRVRDALDKDAHIAAAFNENNAFIGASIKAFRKGGDSAKIAGREVLSELEGFGFAIGDIIQGVNREDVAGPADLRTVLASVRWEEGVSFYILRGKRTLEIAFETKSAAGLPGSD